MFRRGPDFVPPETADRIARAHAGLEAPGRRYEELVPGEVAQAFVGQLEAVEIEEQHRVEGVGPPPGARHGLGDLLLEEGGLGSSVRGS